MENRFLFIWQDSGLSTKSNHVNAPYHFVHFGEVIDYVEKNIEGKVDYIDIEANQTEFQDIMEKIIANNYKAIAFYINTENLQNSIKLNNYIKEINPSSKTIAYGEMPIYLPKYFRESTFDAIVSKECDQEIAILDFFKYQEGLLGKREMRGVILIENKRFTISKKGEYLDSSKWGFTNLEKMPIDSYFKMEKREQVVLTVARGCPYNCPYCNAVLYYGKKERRRPIKDVINYINNNNYEYYKFFAPDFTLNEEYAIEFSKALITNKRKIKWSCTTRPDLLENEEMIKLMAKSGCYKIAIGIESIEPEDLISIDKKYDKNVVQEGIKRLQKYGIEYKALIMFGVPNQTKESIKYTLDFLNKNKVKARPTAYTPFYEMNHNMNAEQISKYDKRTYYEGIEDLSYGDFLRLIYDTKNYKEILAREEEKNCMIS